MADGINNEDLLKLYDIFLDKLQNTVYKVRLGAQSETLLSKRETFKQLSMEEQCIVLSEILHFFQCPSGSANLKLIGGPGTAGTIKINNNITNVQQIKIINQSPTGIYEQEIDLKTL